MRDYRRIRAWQLSDDLTVAIYRITKGFPREELYSLTNQLRRSAYSVPSNIAEGSARHSQKDYLHFLYIARGSLTEVQYFVHLSSRLDYLNRVAHDELQAMVTDTFKCLSGLISAVEKEAGVLKRSIARATSWAVLLVSGVALKGL